MQVSSFYSKGRIIFVITVLSALLLYIVCSYGKLSVKKVPIFTPPVENVERGTILDRNGKTLAVQTNFYHLCATPSVIKDKEKTARVLAPALNLTKENILQLFNSSPTFVYIKK
jgi:cell division protein FtsI (penicillin-binding protein 3)